MRLVVLAALGLVALSAPASAACPAASIYAGAREAFDAKRYDESIKLLRMAYDCDPNPVYLGNVARAYEESNRPKEAIAAWRAYLAVVTDAKERRQTEGRISALSKVVDDLDRLAREKREAEERAEAERRARESRPPPPPPAPAPEPEPERHVSTGAWIVAGAGAIGIATGVVLGLVANGKHSSAVAEPDVVRAEALQSDARGFARAANWAFVLGGAAAAAGVTWIGIDLLAPRRSQTSLAVAGPGVVLRGRW
jgi:hypothetical protein